VTPLPHLDAPQKGQFDSIRVSSLAGRYLNYPSFTDQLKFQEQNKIAVALTVVVQGHRFFEDKCVVFV
jgi:hypothetical protein